MESVVDKSTADAFATSWNNLPTGSVYTFEQFEDWFAPLRKEDIKSKKALELGCGNGSLLVHLTKWEPDSLTGVDLGDSVLSCKENMGKSGYKNFEIVKNDLTQYDEGGYDLVYSIGVLHHLKKPKDGFDAVLRNTKDGGHFHCWVYAKEGNNLVIYLVEPIRRIASKLPWWFTKYLIATPLSVPFYIYGKLVGLLSPSSEKLKSILPLFDYMQWISKRDFLFFRHVAFDQLVTPHTAYIAKSVIEEWLNTNEKIDNKSTYIVFRNGNSWKFGGKKLA